jgi:hypothetical protein
MSDAIAWSNEVARLKAEIGRLRAERDELLAALRDMVEISQRNSEATLMLIAIRKCAEHAIAKAEGGK